MASQAIISHPSTRTRVLIISDTHCAGLRNANESSPFRSPLPSADLLIHCGDLTMDGSLDQYERTLDMLKEIDAPVKLVIAGNHDLTLDRDYVLKHPNIFGHDFHSEGEGIAMFNQVRALWTAPEGRARREGITFLDEGNHRIDLPNGTVANVYASPYTPEFYDWGFPYMRNEDRFNTPSTTLSDAKNIAPYPVPSSTSSSPVDILITHGPPYGRLDQTDRGDFAGCPHLWRAVMRSKPLIHCFGHIHEGWGAETIIWSEQADPVSQEAVTTASWINGSWKDGVAGKEKGILAYKTDLTAAIKEHAVALDVSKTSKKPLRKGGETLLVNAAIMDVQYKPVNAPWLIDIDLPNQEKGQL